MTARRTRKVKAVVRVVIYTRISESDLDETPEHDRQLFDIRRKLNDQFGPDGWTEVAVHYDHDKSASKRIARPEFDKAMGLARDGAVDVVACWRTDRLYRRLDTLEGVINDLESTGVLVVVAMGSIIDLSTADGRLHARVVAAVAQHETEVKQERIRASLEHAARQGWAPAVCGYGYKRVSLGSKRMATFEQVPAEAECIRDLAAMILDDGLTLEAACTRLNDAGRLRRGARWTRAYAHKLFSRDTLAALVNDPDEAGGKLPGNWVPIILPERLEALRADLADPERKHRRRLAPRHEAEAYWLRGHLVNEAGTFLSGGRAGSWTPGEGLTGHRRRIYRIQGRGPSVTVDADALEALLTDIVGRKLPELVALTFDGGPAAPSASESELEAIDALEAELMGERMAGEITKAEWRAAKVGLNKRRAAAEAEIAEARTQRRGKGQVRTGADVLKAWRSGDVFVRREIVCQFVGTITVLPATTVGAGRFRANDPAWLLARLVPAEDSPLGRVLL